MNAPHGAENMRPAPQGWRRIRERLVRRILPRSLLGRMLLIGFIPLLVTQAISLELFYGNYLQIVSRRLSGNMVTTISMTLDMLERYPSPADRQWILDDMGRRADLVMTWREGASLQKSGTNHVLGPIDDYLVRDLRDNVPWPTLVDWKQPHRHMVILVQVPGGILQVVALRKRLDVAPVWLFVAWASGSALVLFLIAALIMRNQVRAIRRLARGGGTVRAGARHGAHRARRRAGNPQGRRGLQPHARPDQPVRGAAHHRSGRCVARPAHAADAPSPFTGHVPARGHDRRWRPSA